MSLPSHSVADYHLQKINVVLNISFIMQDVEPLKHICNDALKRSKRNKCNGLKYFFLISKILVEVNKNLFTADKKIKSPI